MTTFPPLRATTSASNLHRRVRCPGSHWAEHGLPEQDSEYSAEGTLLHKALAKGNEGHEVFSKLDHKQQDVVQSALDLMSEATQRALTAFAVDPDEPFEDGFERELSLRAGLKQVMIGHCDYWRYYPGLKLLIASDAKFGYVEVTPAPINLQLRAYATMFASALDVENAVVAICQPRAFAVEGAKSITIARYSRADLAYAKTQIAEWHKEWMQPDAKRIPSEDACRYCKAKLICPERNARIDALGAKLPTGIADLNETLFGELYDAMVMANKEDFVEAIKEEARVRIAEGRMPGYKLKPNSPRASIEDNVRAARLLEATLNFTPAEVAEASKVSLGQAEQVYRTKTKAKAKEAKERVREALAPVIEFNTPRPSITPVTEHDEIKEV